MIITLIVLVSAGIAKNETAPVELKQIAKEWAKTHFDGTIENGTPYYVISDSSIRQRRANAFDR